MANKDKTKEEMDAMLDFMRENPGMVDKATMDKMYAAMDGANQKEYMKGVLKDLQSHPEMIDDEMKSMMKDMKNKETDPVNKDKETELTQQLEISNKEKETLTGEIDGLRKTIADKDEQLKVFVQKEAETLKKTRESQWQTIKKSIPVGLTHKVEDEQKLRATFEADPYGFAVTLTEFKNKDLPGKEGIEFTQAEVDMEAKDELAAIDELREAGGMNRIRRR